MTTEEKLINNIIEYWESCVLKDTKSDSAINDLIESFAISCGIDEAKLESDIMITIRNMTNSQKRKLYKLMQESDIKEK